MTRAELLALADALVCQKNEPWIPIARVNFWRDKAITAAEALRAFAENEE
jgi:hypothetical protein